jgi:DNA modification methylase
MIRREEIIGDCRLLLGDALLLLDQFESVDSIVTDPPFGVAYKSGHATDALWGDARTIVSDETTAARDLVAEWSDPRPCLMFGSWKVPRPAKTRQVLIWDKGGALGMGDLSIPWKPDHEEIYVLGRGFIGARDSGSVLRCPPVQSMAKNGRLHPNEKPVALMKNLCRKVPRVILDPFMGSGSTGVACAQTGRKFIGVEISQRHFDTACRRIEAAYASPDLFVPAPAKPVQETLL